MSEFEKTLQVCLDALAEGRWDIDECARRYPHYADELRAHLAAAAALRASFDVQPSEEFAEASRERFLIATGQRLSEVYDNDPSPSFFAAARVKFLMTAHRMRMGERAKQTRRLPVFGTPFRALASGMAALALFMSFSTYTVASASDALPGEWQYGVKLQTERVRLALAFGEDAERDLRMDLAAERAREIERLSAKGKIIGPGVLERLTDQTEPLVRAANEGRLDQSELTRLNEVTSRQRNVLKQVTVSDDATEPLAAAQTVSDEGYQVTFVQIVNDPENPAPRVLTPVTPLETEEADSTSTPVPSATPAETPTAGGETPTAVPPTQEPDATPEIGVDPEPVDSLFGVLWVRLSAGRLTTLIPSEKDGWRVMNVNTSGGAVTSPALVQLSNADGTSLVTINPRNGDMYWFILRSGRFDEVQMRLTQNGETRIIDRAALRAAYGDAAEIPIFIMNRIEIEPEAAPVETPEE